MTRQEQLTIPKANILYGTWQPVRAEQKILSLMYVARGQPPGTFYKEFYVCPECKRTGKLDLKLGGPRYQPHVFTEQDVAMLPVRYPE